MKKYIKNDIIISSGTPIEDGNRVYYNPSESTYKRLGWEEYIEPVPQRTLEQAKSQKIIEIVQYDCSENVNDFIVNNEHVWISKADRVGLMNSTNIEKSYGKTETTLWLNGTKLTISCDDLTSMLQQLEEYALICYNVTEEHKSQIQNMSNIQDVDHFDVSKDYPEKLTFNI